MVGFVAAFLANVLKSQSKEMLFIRSVLCAERIPEIMTYVPIASFVYVVIISAPIRWHWRRSNAISMSFERRMASLLRRSRRQMGLSFETVN